MTEGGDVSAAQAGAGQAGAQTEAGQTGAVPAGASEETEPWDSNTFDPLFYPYYGMLNEDEQAVYRQLYYAVSEGEETGGGLGGTAMAAESNSGTGE